jgi:serine/threonine protein kinase
MLRRRRTAPPAVTESLAAVRVIARSERSRVLLGIDPLDGTPVVVKELDVAMVAPAAVKNYLNLAERLTVASTHPNLAAVHAVLMHGDRFVVQLEQYCPGSAALLVADSPTVAPDQTLAIGVRLADALHHLHSHGLLHLDLTLDHVRFANESTPCLADVGLGQLYPPQWRLSRGGSAAGARHTPPEIVEESEPSPTADVYGLASVLYEMLAGRPAVPSYDGDTPASLGARILRHQVLPIHAAGVPRSLSNLLVECLDKRPDHRPADAAALRDALWGTAESLDSAWTGRLSIPEPTGVLDDHDTVVLWQSS